MTLIYFILASLNLYTKVLPRTTLFFWHLCFAFEVVITIGFWTLLAENMLGRFENFGGKAWCALVHIIPLVTLSLEGLVYSRSFTNRSCIAIAAVGLVYLPWNALKAFEAGKNVYGFLPWIQNPMMALSVSVSLLIIVPLLLVGVVSLSKRRLTIAA